MSSTRKCPSCGGLDIEDDPSRGDAVCTACGHLLEVNTLLEEVQFEEGAHGSSTALGHFVAADSAGGPKFGLPFQYGSGVDSRELTVRRARTSISNLCNQLKLSQHCIDTALNFYKQALFRNLTKGRRNTHVFAACVYLTCRTEGTAHLLIDISDVLQICCYELGRTYLKLSQALSINIPVVDPCLYILRFAAQLEFGSKTQLVANTALRLVQRMKRDSIHSGRRPSGLCGAALLIAARLHEFGRSASDIVKIVKVHESTLRKRLIEFGDTPSSALTLEEFMTVDLEEEQDPPSFKAARKKDKERLQRLMEEEAESITELKHQIESQLKRDAAKGGTCRKKKEIMLPPDETSETDRFIRQSTMGTINEIIQNEAIDDPEIQEPVRELGPDIASMGLANSLDDTSNAFQPAAPLEVDLTFDDIDDEELESYILSEKESKSKSDIWLQKNAGFLAEQKLKAERLQKELEEGKPEKKKRKQVRRKKIGPASSAGEAIEKIIKERKISTKLNYDVLKSLTASTLTTKPETEEVASSSTTEHETQENYADSGAPTSTSPQAKRRRTSLTDQPSVRRNARPAPLLNLQPKRTLVDVGLPFPEDGTKPSVKTEDTAQAAAIEEDMDDLLEEDEDEEEHIMQQPEHQQQMEGDFFSAMTQLGGIDDTADNAAMEYNIDDDYNY